MEEKARDAQGEAWATAEAEKEQPAKWGKCNGEGFILQANRVAQGW